MKEKHICTNKNKGKEDEQMSSEYITLDLAFVLVSHKLKKVVQAN